LELESRPLRVEPVPFLWAMEKSVEGYVNEKIKSDKS